MNIQRIAATNLKGQTFNDNLKPMTVITGRNDTGKSARKDAVILALDGHLPDQPRTNQGIFSLSSGSTMSVTAEIGGRPILTRTWKKRGEKVTASAEGTDDLPVTPVPVLNPAAFFKGGETQAVFEICPMDEKAVDIPKLVQGINQSLSACNGTQVTVPGNTNAAGKLAYLDGHLATELSIANATVKRFTATAQGLTTLGAMEKALDPAAVDKALAEARTRVELLVKTEAEARTKATAVADTLRRKRVLVSEITSLQAQITADAHRDSREIQLALTDITQRLGAREARMETIKTDLERWGKDCIRQAEILPRLKQLEEAKPTALLNEKIGDIRLSLRSLTKTIEDLERCTEEVQKANDAVEKLRTRRTTAEQTYDAEIKRLNRLQETRCCPECGVQGEDFSIALKALRESAKRTLDDEIKAIDSQWSRAVRRQDDAKHEHSKALSEDTRRQSLEKILADHQLLLEKAESAAREYDVLSKELAGLSLEKPADAVTLNNEVLGLKEAQSCLQKELESAQAQERRQTLQRELDAIGTIDDSADMDAARAESELEAARERVTELEEEKKQAEAQLADSKRAQQAQDERKKAEALAEAIKTARDEVAAQREALAATALKPVVEVANLFTREILPTPLEFHEGELGRFDGPNWIPVRAFGDCYKAATYAGIQAALGAKAPTRIVIVDELSRMDPANRGQFLDNVRAALDKGIIEQFIGIDPDPGFYTSDDLKSGLHIIRTDK